jgi:hypothetical protein
MSDYSWKELMAVVFSREIKDTDKITSGAHTEIFFAATMLAQKTHAPNMKLQLGGSVTLCNVVDIDVEELPKTSTGYELIRYAESVHDHPTLSCSMAPPAARVTTRKAATCATSITSGSRTNSSSAVSRPTSGATPT